MKVLGLAFALASALSLPMPDTFESMAFGIVPRQSEPSSCGYAVLAGLLNLPGNRDPERPPGAPASITEGYLLERYGEGGSVGNRAPLSMLDMIGILADFGLQTVPSKVEAGLLGAALAAAKPLIIHCDRPVSHFVLGLDADGEFLTIADPECGLVSLAESELAARASGYILLPLPGHLPGNIDDVALSTAIRAANERRNMLAAAASGPRAGSVKRKPTISPMYWEAGVSIGSSGTQTGVAEISTGVFFGLEWAASSALTLVGKASFRRKAETALRDVFELSQGIEWHKENGERNRSLGAALFIAAKLQGNRESAGHVEDVSAISDNPDLFSLEPLLRFRCSFIANPFLLTVTAGMKSSFACKLSTEPQPGATGASSLAFPSEISVLCALSPFLAGKAGLEQEFLFPLDGRSVVEWKAALALGMSFPVGRVLFCVGTRLRLDGFGEPRGEALFSIAF